jgi:fumarate hydratase class II
MHIAAYSILVEHTIPGIEKLRDTLHEKAKAYMNVVKIGRTHFMDATPVTVGQELSGFVVQLNNGIKAIKNTLPHLSELALGGTALGTGIMFIKVFDSLQWVNKFIINTKDQSLCRRVFSLSYILRFKRTTVHSWVK